MAIQVLRAGATDYGTFIKMLVVADAGAGKTRSSSCWPDPLILSAEAGLMSVADRATPHIKVTKSSQVTETIAALQQDPDVRKTILGVPVRTVTLDTVDELARILIRERLESERKEALAIQDWGWLGDQLRGIIRALRNLDMHVILNVHPKSQEDSETGRTFIKPGLQGAMGDEIAAYVDLALLLQARPVQRMVDGNQVRQVQRFYQTYPDLVHPWIKDRSGKLPMEFPVNFDDDYARLHEVIFPTAETEIPTLTTTTVTADSRPEEALGLDNNIAAPGQTTVDVKKIEADQPATGVQSPASTNGSGDAPPAEPQRKRGRPRKTEPVVEEATSQSAAPAEPSGSTIVEESPVEAPRDPAAPDESEIPAGGTETSETPVRNPAGTYSDDLDAVTADCPRDFGCVVEKDMADLSYIRFRKRLCRRCFAEAKRR